jgi:hypothetical protein
VRAARFPGAVQTICVLLTACYRCCYGRRARLFSSLDDDMITQLYNAVQASKGGKDQTSTDGPRFDSNGAYIGPDLSDAEFEALLKEE